MDAEKEPPPPEAADWSRAEIAYAFGLFLAGAGSLSLALAGPAELLPNHGLGTAALFLCYGLFTISIGYRHPSLGYYSFDRVAQVASILVLGPVAAALINGLASFVYPWYRIFKGVPARHALYAALNNAGLMTLIILAAGQLYAALGGPLPLLEMTGSSVLLAVVLVIAMQLLNDLGMLGILLVGKRSTAGFFSGFSYALELGSGATAVLVALVFNNMQIAAFALLLGVLSIGMLALRQFANMRYRLELIVEERTRSLREKTLELEQQATRDNLTGLFNRRYADAFLARQLDTAVRYHQRFTIALADIDLFKQINDLHSHAIGDEVLRRVAALLTERCRKTDMIARYGGEEFLLCFPQTDLREARALCEDLRAAIEAADWSDLSLAARVTLSFGIAERRGDTAVEKLLDKADLHLYSAKDGGRNRVVA